MGKKINKCMIILIGGSDKENTHSVLRNIVNQNEIREVSIVTSATRYFFEVFDNYKRIFENMGCNVSNISNPDSESAEESIRKSDMVFMTGGDQRKLVEKLENTVFLKIMKEKYKAKKLIVAGTSAGAMALSHTMIIGKGDDYESLPGLDFISTTVDTHFSERKRLPRLVSFMVESNIGRGVGIDEDTCMIIREHDLEGIVLFETFESRGSGNCYMIDKSRNKITINIIKDEEIKIDKSGIG